MMCICVYIYIYILSLVLLVLLVLSLLSYTYIRTLGPLARRPAAAVLRQAAKILILMQFPSSY